MASTHVDTVEDLRHALHYWKQHSFDKSYIKLNDAVQSLQSESRLVEARASYLSRWVVCIDTVYIADWAYIHYSSPLNSRKG